MTKTCRVCGEPSGSYFDCDRCWKFRQRAKQKFPKDKRGIKVVGFNNVEEFAKYLVDLYYEEPQGKYCSYTGLEMMVEERGKKEDLKRHSQNCDFSQNMATFL